MTVIVIGASPCPYIWVTIGPSTSTAARRSSWYNGAPPTTTLRKLGSARPRASSTTRRSIVGARKVAWVTCHASIKSTNPRAEKLVPGAMTWVAPRAVDGTR